MNDNEGYPVAAAPGRRMLLEVAVASVEDALATQAGGADRLELNAAPSVGGLTPSLGTLIEVKAAVSFGLTLELDVGRLGRFAFGIAAQLGDKLLGRPPIQTALRAGLERFDVLAVRVLDVDVLDPAIGRH